MNKKQLYQPLMRQLAKSGHDNRYVVDGSSRELLLRIKELFDVFAPIGDDYRHGLWIEVPRGKPSDWASFKEVKDWGEEVNTRKEYLQYWKAEFPRESFWYFISVSQYQGHTYLHITENDHSWCVIHDDQKWDHHGVGPLDWYLEPLLNFLKVCIAEIANNPEAYNLYVEKYLPKHQRIGHIARKDLNRIVPWQRRVPRNLERGIHMLKECMANEEIYRKLKTGETVNEFPIYYRAPLTDMNIRLYAKYFKVAYLAYEEHYAYLYRSNPNELKKKKARIKELSELSDLDFYRRHKLGWHDEITDETDLDSAAGFKKIAKDHYGELGLSRMDVHATDYYTPGSWLITFGISYSAYVDIGMEIAVEDANATNPDLQFELQFEDDEHDPEKSVNAYNTLKDWGMQLLGGTVTTSPCLAVGAEALNDNMLLLTPSASSQDVIDLGENVFQVCFTDPNQGLASADYINDQKLGEKIGVIYNSADAYSSGIYSTFMAEAEAIGLEVVAEEAFTDDNSTDLTTQVQSCQNAGADLIFLPIYYTPASQVLIAADKMGYEPKFFGCDGLDGLLTVEGFDTSLAEGVMLLTPFVADAEDDMTKDFVAKYAEKTGGDVPNQFAADGYDVVRVLYAACEEAGVTSDMDASEVCEAVKAVLTGGEFSYDGLTGEGMTWDASGAVSKAPRGMVIENGQYVSLDA